jgi:hypothetical protein
MALVTKVHQSLYFVFLSEMAFLIMRFIYYIVISVLVLISCKPAITPEHIIMTGHFPALPGQMVYLDELEVRGKVALDSAIIDDEGHFQLKILSDLPGFFMLRTNPQNSILLLIEKNDEPSIHSEHRDFNLGYQVDGSEGSNLLQAFELFMQKQKSRLDSIAEAYYDARGTENFLETKEKLDAVYEDIVADQKIYTEQFVNTNPGSIASLIVLNRKLGQVHILDEEEDFILFHRTDSVLTIKYPGNKHVADHNKRVREIRSRIFDRKMAEEKVKPGIKAPDIVLPDTSGKMISLKSFAGMPTILYFWAGWNAQSRLSNRRLAELYPDWQKNNIQILGISLDEHAVIWKGAIQLDQLAWPQVSDLKGIDSPVRWDYNLPDKLPFYYLLDDKLKIVYKHDHLDSLITKLDQIFF